jgi:hypothetical protein
MPDSVECVDHEFLGLGFGGVPLVSRGGMRVGVTGAELARGSFEGSVYEVGGSFSVLCLRFKKK